MVLKWQRSATTSHIKPLKKKTQTTTTTTNPVEHWIPSPTIENEDDVDEAIHNHHEHPWNPESILEDTSDDDDKVIEIFKPKETPEVELGQLQLYVLRDTQSI